MHKPLERALEGRLAELEDAEVKLLFWIGLTAAAAASGAVEGRGAREIAAELGWSKTKAARLLGRLEERGWIVLEAHPNRRLPSLIRIPVRVPPVGHENGETEAKNGRTKPGFVSHPRDTNGRKTGFRVPPTGHERRTTPFF